MYSFYLLFPLYRGVATKAMESKLLLETDTVAPDETKAISSKKEEEVGILQFPDQLEETAKHYFSRNLETFNHHIGS